MVWVKVCGMTTPADALAAADAGADAIGMLFAPSTRRVGIEQARAIVRALPRHVEKVGLFYDEAAETIEAIADAVGLTAVQLHGDETPGFVAGLFRGGRRSRLRVFKTIHMTGDGLPEIDPYLRGGIVDAVLLDTVVKDAATGAVRRGGTGQAFDWAGSAAFLDRLADRPRVIVAGGLTSANLADAVRILRPWGVDVCSSVEREPGTKDVRKVREFVAAAREFD